MTKSISMKKLVSQHGVLIGMSIFYYKENRMLRAIANYEAAAEIARLIGWTFEEADKQIERICNIDNVDQYEWSTKILKMLMAEDKTRKE